MTPRRTMSWFCWISAATLYFVLMGLEMLGARIPGDDPSAWTFPFKLLLTPEKLAISRSALLAVIALVGGLLRVGLRHPANDHGYRAWLAMTPWRPGLPLPRGPFTPTFSDAAIIAGFTLLSVIDLGWPIVLWPVLYMTPYVLMLWLAAHSERVLFTLVGFLWPAMLIPHHRIEVSLGVLALISALVLWATQRKMAKFPFESPDWRREGEAPTVKAGKLGYPFSTLAPGAAPKRRAPMRSLLTAAMAAWWLTAAFDLAFIVNQVSWDQVAYDLIHWQEPRICGVWWPATGLLVFIRWASYRINGGPPIGFFGRFATGRLVFPDYDVIWLGPLAIVAAAGLAPWGLWVIGAPAPLALGGSVFLMLAALLLTPPSTESWQMTGRRSIARLEDFTSESDRPTVKG